MSTDRLTGLDASFLHLERDGAHMHVASTMIFDGPPPGYDEFRDHLESRLHLVPRFRQKLRFVPFGQGRPIWVDDPHLNLDYHVRHTALPTPGSEEQLRNFAARAFSQRLDRTKPLWELWLVDGLAGDRFAIVCKTHHCLVDGVSGVDITTVLFDADQDPSPAEPGPSWVARPEPSDAELLAAALVERGHPARRAAPRRSCPDPRPAPGVRGRPRRRRGRGRVRRQGTGGARLAAQRRDRLPPALRLGPRRPVRPQADQGRARRHRQRRRPGGGHRGPRPPPARARPRTPTTSSCARWCRSASAPPRATGSSATRSAR